MMKKLLLAVLLLRAALFAQTTYYIQPAFTGGSNNGTQAHPFTGFGSGGTSPLSWSTINTNLATGSVTVYLAATTPGTNTATVSTTGIDLSQRTDTSTNVLTIDGESFKDAGTATTPSWVTNFTLPPLTPCVEPIPSATNPPTFTCGQNTSPRYTIQNSSPITGPTGGAAPNNCKYYFDIRGISFQENGGGQGANMTYIGHVTFEFNEVTAISGVTGGPGLYIGPGQNGPCHTGAARPNGTDQGPDAVTSQYNLIHDEWGECTYSGASTGDPFVNGAPGNSQQVEGGSVSGTNLACGNGCGSGNPSCTAASAANAAACGTGDSYFIQYNTEFGCAAWGAQGDGVDFKDGHTNAILRGNQLWTSRYPNCAPTCSNLICYGGTNGGTTCTTNAQCTGGGRCGAAAQGARGFIIESCSLVDGNLIYQPGVDAIDLGDAWNNSTGRVDCKIINNLVVDVNSGNGHQNGYELEGLNVSGLFPWGNISFFNNTGYNIGNISTNTGVGIITASGAANGTVRIANNIISTSHQAISAGVGTEDHNDCFNNTTGTCAGTGDITTDPQFISTAAPPTAAGFKLQAASAAKGAGVNFFSTFTDDYFGANNRPNLTFTMGMFELQTALLSTPSLRMISLYINHFRLWDAKPYEPFDKGDRVLR